MMRRNLTIYISAICAVLCISLFSCSSDDDSAMNCELTVKEVSWKSCLPNRYVQEMNHECLVCFYREGLVIHGRFDWDRPFPASDRYIMMLSVSADAHILRNYDFMLDKERTLWFRNRLFRTEQLYADDERIVCDRKWDSVQISQAEFDTLIEFAELAVCDRLYKTAFGNETVLLYYDSTFMYDSIHGRNIPQLVHWTASLAGVQIRR